MSELNVYHHELRHNEYDEFYLKYEADKVLAELEENHKKEVEQLLIEIVKLKDIDSKNRSAYYKDLAMIAKDVERQKYKRCLAMAEWCNSEMVVETFASFRPRSTKEVLREENKYWAKWRKIWFELAMKFKEEMSESYDFSIWRKK